jgi:elongation factor P--beta-lysine ligase
MNKFYKKYSHLSKDELNGNLIASCKNGDLDAVKYLLTSPELKLHADIFCQDYYCLITAAWSNHFEIVKYLLTSPDLTYKANIHANEDRVFKVSLSHENKDLMMFLIHDMNIQKTKHIKKALKYLDPKDKETILKNFKTRDFSKQLNAELDLSLMSNNNKKLKI